MTEIENKAIILDFSEFFTRKALICRKCQMQRIFKSIFSIRGRKYGKYPTKKKIEGVNYL